MANELPIKRRRRMKPMEHVRFSGEKKQIFRIYKLGCALQEAPYDSDLSPHELSRKAGIHHDRITTYIQHVIFYQNFFPRVSMKFDGDGVKIFKRGPPAAFSIISRFYPWVSILLKLFDLKAFGGNSVELSSPLQLSDSEEVWLDHLRIWGLVRIEHKRVVLTSQGVYEALEQMDRFCSLRDKTISNLPEVTEDIDTPTVVTRPALLIPVADYAAATTRRNTSLPRLRIKG